MFSLRSQSHLFRDYWGPCWVRRYRRVRKVWRTSSICHSLCFKADPADTLTCWGQKGQTGQNLPGPLATACCASEGMWKEPVTSTVSHIRLPAFLRLTTVFFFTPIHAIMYLYIHESLTVKCYPISGEVCSFPTSFSFFRFQKSSLLQEAKRRQQ